MNKTGMYTGLSAAFNSLTGILMAAARKKRKGGGGDVEIKEATPEMEKASSAKVEEMKQKDNAWEEAQYKPRQLEESELDDETDPIKKAEEQFRKSGARSFSPQLPKRY